MEEATKVVGMTDRFLSERKDCCDSELTDSTNEWRQDSRKNLNESLKVLDPEDPLMKRFQDSLKAHLTRIDRRLSEDILSLENYIRESKKLRESKAGLLYTCQQEISHQQDTIEKYQTKLGELTKLRDEKDSHIDRMKELRKLMKNEVDSEKNTCTEFNRQIESLLALSRQFEEWQREIVNYTKVSKRMSEKEAAIQRGLLKRKQHEDYILTNLMEEVSKLENEIKVWREQLVVKEQERLDVGQTITDANTDLDGLQRTQKKLFSEWNSVVASISQRDKVFEELDKERGKIRESFTTLSTQIEKLKKDTSKEMENNERLTSVETRLETEVHNCLMAIGNEKSKIDDVEGQLIDASKLMEQTQNEFDTACWDYQRCIDEEKKLDKDSEKLTALKNQLEDRMLSRLENKVSRDKIVKSLNKTLRETHEKIREDELMMLQTENIYGRNVLELEKLNGIIATEKYDVEDIVRMNSEKEKELDVVQSELKKSDVVIMKKQQKIVGLNKKIEEIISSMTGGEEVSPQDLKITELEKSIEEMESSNRKSQDFWLRQESYMVTLSEERTEQLREINLFGKQITIMEQKNLKLEREIEAQRKESENICRTVKSLQQKLLVANERLAVQRDVRDDLEDKNCITRTECMETLREAEIELLKMQNDIKQLAVDRKVLEEQLRNCQRETLSWEKKVSLASQTTKKLKEEDCAGGDVALMKSEIHKMEMRLSHLRKAQEKMIRDMEFCVARRDVILDGALAREKRNPKGLHNQRVIFEKRMKDQRSKIKQINKETKQLENQILELESQQKILVEHLDENQRILRSYEDEIPDIDKKITEGELVKYHKLECLVRKQRKVRMLQDVKDGRYKMIFKSELSLNDELLKQRTMSSNLREALEEAQRDFPLLKDSIRKILLGMVTS